MRMRAQFCNGEYSSDCSPASSLICEKAQIVTKSNTTEWMPYGLTFHSSLRLGLMSHAESLVLPDGFGIPS